jgi:hypothetical protein
MIEKNPYRAGGYDKATNIMYISEHVVTAKDFLAKDFSMAVEFYLTVSILHEFVHFGENYTQTFLPHENGYDDSGYKFENEAYGGRVKFDYKTGNITYEKL